MIDLVYFIFFLIFILFYYLFPYFRLRSRIISSLLSFIPPSCMVAPNIEIANKFFPFNISAMSNSVEVHNLSEDINMDETRGRSIAPSSISSRATSTHSNTLSIPYVDRMKVQNNNFFWLNQTEQENFQLSYTSLKKGNSDDQNKNQVSVVADSTKNTREQYISIKDLVLNFSCSSNKNMFNM